MDWKSQIVSACNEKGYELAQDTRTNELHIFCPEKPTQCFREAMERFAGGNAHIVFDVAPKQSTTLGIMALVQNLRGKSKANEDIGHLEIDLDLEPNDVEGLKDHVHDMLLRDKFFKSWTVTVKGNEILDYNRKVAEECEGHNIRESIFTDDDMLNLKIALESAETVDAFLESIGGSE